MHGLWNIWPHGSWRNMEEASISSKHRSHSLGNDISVYKTSVISIHVHVRAKRSWWYKPSVAYQCLNTRIVYSMAFVLTRRLAHSADRAKLLTSASWESMIIFRFDTRREEIYMSGLTSSSSYMSQLNGHLLYISWLRITNFNSSSWRRCGGAPENAIGW